MSRASEIHARKKAEAAASLPKAEAEALSAGKEPFDPVAFERLLNRGPQGTRVEGHREAYYVAYREFKTMAEYVAHLHAIEPWEDSS